MHCDYFTPGEEFVVKICANGSRFTDLLWYS